MSNNIIYLNCEDDDYISDSINKKYTEYTLEECVLVRTTDTFPFDKIIQTPINGHAYDFAKSTIIGDTINNKIKQNMPSSNFQDIAKVIEEQKKYHVCFASQRTTLHFAINGLVSSHLYGNFDGRLYIIIEPLKYHLKDKSLLSLRVEDTYFNDDMLLSDEAAIIITEEKFNEIKNNPEYISTLEKFRVFVYKGQNEKKAVQKTLEQLGYDSFVVNNNGYVSGLNDDTAANKMWNLMNTLRETYNISGDPHYYSDVRIQDDSHTNELGKKTDKEHLLYIINNATTINEEVKNKILMLINREDLNPKNSNDIITEIIDTITLEEIKRLTDEFNQLFINTLKQEKNNKIK